MTNRIVGIDIGGANLKYACSNGQADSRPFPMWKRCGDLSDILAEHVANLGQFDHWAVTMTGELADCFADRAEGVTFIVDSALRASKKVSIQTQSHAPEVSFYGVDGRFHNATQSKDAVDLVAAANWHALASIVARTIARDGILVDIGSTTTDIIPLAHGRVATHAMTDYERLVEQSLVYVGCRRTPVCGLVDHLSIGGVRSRVMNEMFATIDDARIVLRQEAEYPHDCDTADSGPRTRDRSAGRMARMVGLDRRSLSFEAAAELSIQVLESAKQQITEAFEAIATIAPEGPVIVCGHGGDLLALPANREAISLNELLGAELSRCAPAWAIAQLRGRELNGGSIAREGIS